tara:strand:- start:116 stop:400 length:285 start_codon:yes stop_codon:yes gene_type:complete
MKVGDKVRCVNDDFSQHIDVFIKAFDQLPQRGVEYTIRRIERWDGKVRILLEEIKNQPFKDGPLKGAEPGFDSKRFDKPIKEKVSLEVEEEMEA